MSRVGRVERTTKETSVLVEIDLDGTGKVEVSTGVGFYDHMLDQLGRHGLFDLTVKTEGDLHIDSQYVRDGITKYINNWKRNGWRTASRDPVKNQDLWQRLDAARGHHTVHWHWVKGHSGDVYNERADELVRQARDALRSGK